MKVSDVFMDAMNEIDDSYLKECEPKKASVFRWKWIAAVCVILSAVVLVPKEFTTEDTSEAVSEEMLEEAAEAAETESEAEAGMFDGAAGDTAAAADRILSLTSEADLLYDISDPAVCYAQSSDIVIGTVKEITGTSAVNESGEAVYPYTCGMVEVMQVLKGESITDGSVISVSRMGAVISYEEYYASLSEEQRQKLESELTDGVPAYVDMHFEGDIPLEEGKTYLMYLNGILPENAYECVMLQGGLREVKTEGNETLVLNNFTGEWELLSEIPFESSNISNIAMFPADTILEAFEADETLKVEVYGTSETLNKELEKMIDLGLDAEIENNVLVLTVDKEGFEKYLEVSDTSALLGFRLAEE